MIIAVVSGQEDWVLIDEFGKDQLGWLRKFFHYPNGRPSHNCLGDVFGYLDMEAFEKSL